MFPKPHKPDEIRLRVDTRLPNQAIQRDDHPKPETKTLKYMLMPNQLVLTPFLLRQPQEKMIQKLLGMPDDL